MHTKNQKTTNKCYTFPKAMQSLSKLISCVGCLKCLKRLPSQLEKYVHLPVMRLSQVQEQVLEIFQDIELKAGSLFCNISACRYHVGMF